MAFLKAFQGRLEEHVADIPFFISLASWFHGLNTTMGQQFFEKVSHILCDGTKKKFESPLILSAQAEVISDRIARLKNNLARPDLEEEDRLIEVQNSQSRKEIDNFTVDCYFEDDEGVVAIELKTVRPNSGEFKGEKQKILRGRAFLRNTNPGKVVRYFLGFPFDPLSRTPTGSDKEGFIEYSVDFKKFFDPSEILLAGGLWDFLSGTDNTMQQLLDIINAIATPDFMEKYAFLNLPDNKTNNREQYLRLLAEWKLISETKLVLNEQAVLERIGGDRAMTRKFHQPMFIEEDYNLARCQSLLGLFDQ